MPDPLTITGIGGGAAFGSPQDMHDRAAAIEREERARHSRGVGIATTAFNESKGALSNLIDPNLLFSRASDSVGAQGRSSLEGLRRSLGSRGISPNSGAAGGSLERLAFARQGALVGATRDIGIENQRQRQVNAAQNFANALNLGQAINAPVPGALLETSQNIFEGNLAREAIASQRRSNKDANKTGLLGSLIGGGLGLLGGLF